VPANTEDARPRLARADESHAARKIAEIAYVRAYDAWRVGWMARRRACCYAIAGLAALVADPVRKPPLREPVTFTLIRLDLSCSVRV
jgi:hypothetical protein